MLKFLRLTSALSTAVIGLISDCYFPKKSWAIYPDTSLALVKGTPISSLGDKITRQFVDGDLLLLAQQPNFFQQAIDAAESAVFFGQTAQSKDDWDYVGSLWKEAIGFLKSVPTSHPKYQIALKKIKEYERYLSYANQQVARLSQPKPSIASTPRVNPPGQPAPAAPSTSGSIRQLLDNYFQEVINKGGLGYEYFCSLENPSSLIAPRSYKILDIIDNNATGLGVVRVDSSNSGGVQVTLTWWINLQKQSGKWCISGMIEKFM